VEAQAHERALQIRNLKHAMAKLQHDQFGHSAECHALLNQIERELFELWEGQTRSEVAAEVAPREAVTGPYLGGYLPPGTLQYRYRAQDRHAQLIFQVADRADTGS
jgi:hypothetical protein